MNLIQGTKRWTLTLTGVVPPGVSEQDVAGQVLASVAVPLHLVPSLRETQVTFQDDFGASQRGPKLT